MKKGIDVSKHNGVIDFQKVKAAGYDFVIIRAGYGKSATQKDTMFDLNYAKAKAAVYNRQQGSMWVRTGTAMRYPLMRAGRRLWRALM